MGVCVRCRTSICSECVTKVDGINYCVACLSHLADEDHRPSRPAVSRSSGLPSAVLLFVVLVLLTWVMVEVAMPGAA
jgi:hypothetical protein